jgi:uncharacterized protein involved in response to NO
MNSVPSAPDRQPAVTAFTLKPFATLARISLVLGTVAGFGLGFVLLLPVAFRLPVALPWLPLVQVHGQVQTLGFAALFIFAVGTILFPRFLGVPGWNASRATRGGLLLAAGVTLRTLSQPLEPSTLRSTLLLLSGPLTLLGPLLFMSALVQGCRRSVQPFALWNLALGIGFISLVLGLLLNIWAVARLALEGLSTVPLSLDEAIVTLEIRGFLVGVGLAVSLKVFPQFLILRPARPIVLVWALPGYAVGLSLQTLGWLLLEVDPTQRSLAAAGRATGDLLALAALTGFVLALRLYEPAARESGRPELTNPTRLWFRLAYAWLVGATLLSAWLSLRELLGGAAASFTELSAARHALTMGFLMVLLVGMATRILPGYSGWALVRPRFLALMIGLLLLGALVRVGGELAGGYSGIYGPLTGLGGTIGTVGFLLFAASLWPALVHLPSQELPVRT